MNRIENISNKINFIGSWYINNDELFEKIITFFENNKHLHNQGAIDSGISLLEKKLQT